MGLNGVFTFGVLIIDCAIFSPVVLFLIFPWRIRYAETFGRLKECSAAPRVNSCFSASWPLGVAANAENEIEVT